MNRANTLLAIVLLTAGYPALAAPLASCPQQHREGKRSALLDSASVFDGAPDNKADLMPDLAKLEWDLATSQDKARERGDSIYLVCKYKGIASTVAIKLPPAAALCKMEGINGRTRMWCGERPDDTATHPR
jgi:hypothetical protein